MSPAKMHCPIATPDTLCPLLFHDVGKKSHLIKQHILTFCSKDFAQLWFMRFNKVWVTTESQSDGLNQLILGPVQPKTDYSYLEGGRNTAGASDRYTDL